MTNEKDRKEAWRLAQAIWSVSFPMGLIDQKDGKVDAAVAAIARIRFEAYREGYLDGCSVDGTQTERDRATVAESVKTELERCIASARSKIKSRKDSDNATLIAMNAIYNQAIDDVIAAILSDDQESNK